MQSSMAKLIIVALLAVSLEVGVAFEFENCDGNATTLTDAVIHGCEDRTGDACHLKTYSLMLMDFNFIAHKPFAGFVDFQLEYEKDGKYDSLVVGSACDWLRPLMCPSEAEAKQSMEFFLPIPFDFANLRGNFRLHLFDKEGTKFCTQFPLDIARGKAGKRHTSGDFAKDRPALARLPIDYNKIVGHIDI